MTDLPNQKDKILESSAYKKKKHTSSNEGISLSKRKRHCGNNVPAGSSIPLIFSSFHQLDINPLPNILHVF